MKERNEMKCDVIYRCVSFIIDYQYFSETVCKLCAMNFCVQRKSRYKSLCNGLISFVLCFVDQPGLEPGTSRLWVFLWRISWNCILYKYADYQWL